MDPHNPAQSHQPVGGHTTDPPTTTQSTTTAIITTPLATPTATATPNVGAPTVNSIPSPPTTPIAIMSDAGGPPWPRPPTPGPGPPLPDRIFSFDGSDSPPHTPIAGPSLHQQPLSPYPFTNNHYNLAASNPVNDSTPPNLLPDIFEPPKEPPQGSRPVLRLRPETGEREGRGEPERHGAMGSLDEIVNLAGFEIGDPASEDFYADADGPGSEASSLSSLWASRAYLDRRSGDVGESVRIGEHEHEHHTNNGEGSGKGNEKGKHKAEECTYYNIDLDPHHDGYFSDSGTATGDEAPRRAGPFVPSFHDSQATPVKRGSFVFRNGYEAEDGDVHERGGDGDGEVRVPVGCELEYPLAPGGSRNRRSNGEGARLAPSGPERVIHRLPAPAPVCIRRPPTSTPFYRGRRRHRTSSPECIPNPSVIQLLTPLGTVGAQFNNVADVQVTTEIGLLGAGYGMREIRSNGGCDEIRRGWGGVKGCVVEFKGGDKWELNLRQKETGVSKVSKGERDSLSRFYDGDDEGTIGAASDAENAVAQLNAQPTNPDFVLGPGETRPYILDVISDDLNKAVTRYTDVADYSVHLQDAEKRNSFMVRVRDVRGALVIMWKRVARVEIVLVGGVVVEISVGDGRGSEDDGGEVVAEGVGLRGGGDKDKGGEEKEKEKGQATVDYFPAVETFGSSRLADSLQEFSFPRVGSVQSSDDESGVDMPTKTRQDKGKGKAVDDGDATPRNYYHADSENDGFIPLYYETPGDYTQTLGPPRRLENPEPDYVLGSCPCLDRPITDADTNADPPQCTCIRPASPEPPALEPWAGGYFSPRYQAFLRNGPPNEPYSHSCTAHSESHGEWVGEVRGNLEEDLANQAYGSGVAADAAPPNEASSATKPLDRKLFSSGSPSEDALKMQRNEAEEEGMKDQADPAPVSELDRPSEAAKPEGSRNSSHAHSSQRDNVENESNSFANVGGETARGNTTGGNNEERNTGGGNNAGRNTARRGQPQAYTDRHASGFHSFQGPPHLPPFYPLHAPPSPFHFPGQPTITTIQFFPPHEFPSIHYQHPHPAPYPPFLNYSPFIPHPQNPQPNSHPQRVHQPISTLPEIPESNYFYPDGRSARFRFPTPPGQAAGQQQSAGNHEHVPPTATQSPARITQATASQPAPPGSSSRGYHGHQSRLVEEQIVRLMEAFELLRDMHMDIAQRLDSGRL
ncbi:hypothetical protein V502_10379 [Pseudogymnoascus sp. VKM F-4520 (FW-2644)]|nr:hypothetical protein V502_10379 [Pseudogymnoascus sp. VKM F-4520 (FW-2644)]